MKPSRRRALGATAALLGAANLALPAAAAETPAPAREPIRVYFGTYTGAKSQGIYLSTLNRSSGTLTAPALAAETVSPSFLALHPSRRFLYAVNEVSQFDGQPGGSVSAFAIDAGTGRLRPLNRRSTRGSGPCHLVVDASGRNVLVANYGGGSVTSLRIEADGTLGTNAGFVQHRGSSVHPRRQEGPHAHGIYLDSANRLALVPDLGLDRVLIYRFDPETGSLSPGDPPSFAPVRPGAGPRHLAFHPNGRFVYVINELQSTITAFAFDAERGRLSERQTISTLPADFSGDNSTAEIAVHPGGRFLFGSNRGHDSLAALAVDEATGQLSLVGHTPTRGRTPRNFGLDPSGTFLLAANQGSDRVEVFRLDGASGQLAPAGPALEVGAPVCVLFAPEP